MEAMEKYESISSKSELTTSSMRLFTVWILMVQAFGLTAVILVAVWMGHFRGGFAWQDHPEKEFNYHPLFMVIGMVFLFGNALLVYRVFRNERKVYIKALHAALQVLALLFSAVGLKAVFDSHNLPEKKVPNMYSLHSWLGLATILLFGLQWVMGLVTFLFPGLHQNFRSIYKPVHVFWGLAIYIMAIATALTGTTEKAFFSNHDYSSKNAEGMIINVLGAVLVAMGMTVGYILTRSEYQRQSLPDEEHIALTRD